MNADLLQQASALDIDDKIELVAAIWESIASSGAAPVLIQAQEEELDRRLDDYLQNPDDVISWDEVKTAATRRFDGYNHFAGNPALMLDWFQTHMA